MKPNRLNASKGTRLLLEEGGRPFTGVIIASRDGHPLHAVITIRTSDNVTAGARLTIPSIPEAGGCGAAYPTLESDHFILELNVGYEYINTSTIGE